jgi:hypothetical protein
LISLFPSNVSFPEPCVPAGTLRVTYRYSSSP